jgi:hypothetical protein
MNLKATLWFLRSPETSWLQQSIVTDTKNYEM